MNLYQVYEENATGLLYFVEKYYKNSGNVALRGLFTDNHMNPSIVAGKLKIITDVELHYSFRPMKREVNSSHTN